MWTAAPENVNFTGQLPRVEVAGNWRCPQILRTMEGMDVTLAVSVDAFFHEMVAEAVGQADLGASEPATWYLVTLLGEFARQPVSREPLGLRLVEPVADGAAHVKRLKEVGDTSLYVAGYFTESLARSLVDVDYYVGLGQSAYHQLARQLSGAALGEVYAELADKFPAFVDVLMLIRRRVDYSTSDINKLYEIWLRTRDAWVEKKLRQAGVIIGSGDPGTKVIQ